MTCSRNTSPVAIEDNCGNLFINLSVCVPFPTPGAPTSMILAAFFNFLAAVLTVILNQATLFPRHWRLRSERVRGGKCPGRSAGLLESGTVVRIFQVPIMITFGPEAGINNIKTKRRGNKFAGVGGRSRNVSASWGKLSVLEANRRSGHRCPVSEARRDLQDLA